MFTHFKTTIMFFFCMQEWVPVISQDIIRQQRMPRQAPFSDAYLNGMPPKRRKVELTIHLSL